ncbi:hypothetical protein HG536_0A02430 [Torulaspora globosa]|uniref:Peroxisomal membrane protein PEX14 n=1 Tax=Torulaspora globosa TaxID=48254 RepID=A0A7G3ZA90_9SACH|nr:uncharacterized protein HG536_0A02430 [Torulaspora globosa]QLL30426.1 hypothetical protein HG536_0A02430 [Torulaspora globosa]
MSKVKDDRKDLFESAVSFLGDASVKEAPLTKKIEFLQSKGLTQEEVELALREAQEKSGGKRTGTTYRELSGARHDESVYEAMPPPIPRRDWKDYFVMATATAGLLYGVYEITRRYVIPNLLPDSKSKLEQDKEEIQSYFDKVDKVLNAIEEEQEKARARDDEKLEELEATIYQLQTCLEKTAKTRDKMEDEFKMLKLEIMNLQSTIDKHILNKENVRELEKVNNELSSLKNLINSTMSDNANDEHGRGHKSPLSKNAIPGADTIPSAADILTKLNLDKKEGTPAWKKARDESLGSAGSSIPEWQKSSLNEVNIPNWQNTLERAELEEDNENSEPN